MKLDHVVVVDAGLAFLVLGVGFRFLGLGFRV